MWLTPDITVLKKNRIWFIGVVCPTDSNVEDKKLKKITKCKDLQIETMKELEFFNMQYHRA